MNVTADLRQALRDRYPPPEWAMAFEVQAPREDGGLRFADAIAFDTRKGAGMAVHGFELKVSRADWLAELAKPDKADAARSLCDYWWVVAGTRGIVNALELPKGVGLLVPENGVLVTQEYASTTRGKGQAGEAVMDRSLVAALLRRLDPMEPRAYWEGRERRAEQKGYAKGRNAAMRVQRKNDRAGRVEEPAPGDAFCP